MEHAITRPCRLKEGSEMVLAALDDVNCCTRSRQLSGVGDANSQLSLLAGV
jgi:hypothetical protein